MPPPRVVIAGGTGFLAKNLLRTDPELALYGRYCVSRRLREEGFLFKFEDLPAALRDLLLAKAAGP